MSNNKNNDSLLRKVYKWRVFPRLFSAIYIVLMILTVLWIIGHQHINATDAAFASTVFGAGAAWFKFYVQSGPGTKNNIGLDP